MIKSIISTCTISVQQKLQLSRGAERSQKAFVALQTLQEGVSNFSNWKSSYTKWQGNDRNV